MSLPSFLKSQNIMTTKVYGIYGRTTAVLRIPAGKAYIEVEFSRGVPNAGPNYRPATFSTSDPVVQSVLEKSQLFGSLYTIYRIVRDEPEKKTAAAAKKQDVEPLEGIETKEEAVAYLKSRGAKATNLRDAESILKYAEKIGVSFPNLSL